MKLQKAGYEMAAPEGFDSKPLAKYLEKEYGDMIPKTYLSSLPDFKVTEFIRVLAEYQKKCESQ